MEAKVTIEGLRKKHRCEEDQFIGACPHVDVLVEDISFAFRRSITIRCKRCRLNLLGYVVDGSQSYLSYVRDCVNGYPGSNRKAVAGQAQGMGDRPTE